MTVFSTFAERGPCAGFLSLTVLAILVSRRWRLSLGWPEALLILSTILLTMVRTGLILIGVGVLIHPLLNRGKAAIGLIVLVAMVALGGGIGLNHMPNSERISDRYSSFGNMKEDASLNGRLGIADAGLKMAISNPIGYGIGSSGLAGRLNTGTTESEAVIGDNGYLELLTAFGVPGGLLFAAAFFLLWRHLSMCSRFGLVDDYLAMARTFFLVLLIGLLAGDFFSGLSVMFIAFGQALSPRMLDKLVYSIEPPWETEPSFV